jgi:MFS family permease/SepF-like predicted cell division protein (DUF552 family)
MDNTQIKVDEPRKDECEAYRIVLLDGENFKGKGETGIRIVRLGGPVNRKNAKGMEVSPLENSMIQVANAVASKKEDGDGRKEGGKATFRPQSPSRKPETGGVRVVDLKKTSDKEAEKRKKKESADSKVKEEIYLRKDLNNSIAEGSFTTASSSIVSSYATPFALFLNASNSEIGLLTSVQNLAGILSQLPGARLTRSMTRKRIWFLSTILSRLFLIPLIFIGLFFSGSTEIWVLIILLGAVSFFSTMRGPAWSSMMGDIVPHDRRGRYFGKRNMVIGFAGMVATLGAGAAIYWWGFPVIFAIAIVLTLVSIMFFIRIREPEYRQDRVYHYRPHFHPKDLVFQIKTNRNFAIFTAYMTVVNFGVNVAAPFVAVYMLKNLDVGYGWFAILVTIGALVQLLSMKYWGGRCDRYGNRRILMISGFLICFVPFGYMLSTNVWHLMLLKVYDGFVWGAFDLVVFNYLLAVTPSDKRPGFVANHNFMTGTGTVLGALFGAFLAEQFQTSGFFLLYGLQTVFLISFIMRLSSLAFLPKIAEVEVKQDECMPVRYIFWDTVAIGPAKGVEHAISNAFRYPYGVKIKSKLGLNNSRKIRISARSFAQKDSGKKPGPAEKHVFNHIGVLPIKTEKIGGGKTKERGVFKMVLGEKKKEDEYMELGLESQSPKAAKIIIHSLQRFSETDKIVKNIRAKNVVFVGLKAMKQSNMDELKQAVAKINRACAESGSNMSLVEEEWLIITPQTAAIV